MTENFIGRLKTGDTQAYAELVAENQQMILTVCYKFLRDADDAKDTSQEVFIEVFRSIKSFREDAELKTWLYRIAVNRSIDAMRKKKRKHQVLALRQVFEKVTRRIADPSQLSRPDGTLELAERNADLTRALEKLPKNQQSALVLSKCDGLSNTEIAEILNVSVSSVESLIHRAKRNMHEILGDRYAQR